VEELQSVSGLKALRVTVRMEQPKAEPAGKKEATMDK
jgi:hypothetical protein